MKILIIRLSAIGDIIHTLPVLTTLKENFPNSEIHWLVEKKVSLPIKNDKRIDKLIFSSLKSIDNKKEKFTHILELIKSLRKEKYDIVFDFQGLIKTAIFARLSGAQSIVGFSNSREYTKPFYTKKFKSYGTHVIEKNLSLLKQYFKNIKLIRESNISIDKESEKFGIDYYKKFDNSKTNIIINVGGGWYTKRYPIPLLKEVISILKSKSNKVQIHILRGPDEKADAKELKEGNDSIIPDKSLTQMISAIKYGDIMVSSDTGPLHVAAAHKIPCVALFGPTDFNRNGAYNTETIAIYAKIDCMNCYKRKCDNWFCMSLLKPEEIADSILKLMRVQKKK